MNRPDESNTKPSKIPRREFIKTTGTASVAAASWWGVTAKVDAMQSDDRSSNTALGNRPPGPNYDYDEGR